MWGRTWDELRAAMPDAVRESLLPWEWSRDRLWRLELPVRRIAVADLRHLLDVPLWRDEDGMPFAVAPRDVLAAPARYPSQAARVRAADLAFPIDVTPLRGGWIVLDGVHRLAKAASLGRVELSTRVVPTHAYPEIRVR